MKRKRRIYHGSPTLWKDAVDVVSDFGALLEGQDAMAIYDTSQLPQPKEEMKLALKTAWKLTSDPTVKSAIEACFITFSHFRAGIGSKPVQFLLPDPANITKESLAAGEMYLKLSQEVQEETAQLSAELDAFIAHQNDSRP
jgi:hypothetical protein